MTKNPFVKDFPEQFATEESCFRHLVECRWPKGFVCPKCRGKKYWLRLKRKLLVCQGCRREVSPTAGTVMHRSHIPLQEWFCAFHLLSTLPSGLSAVQLQKRLGIGSYQTAWSLLHRLRKGMTKKLGRRIPEPVEVGGGGGDEHLNAFKNWLKETHRGIAEKNLQSYLDEYIFLFDRSKNATDKFHRLLNLMLKPKKNSPLRLKKDRGV